jgi:spore coat polysaccharide biosynthesis predicted glycosyltransferase SpsG
MSKVLTIRADADFVMGTGHLMRCLALGQAWKDAGGEVVFVTGCQSGELLRRLRDEGFKVHVLNAIYPNPHDWAFTRRILTAASPA